LKWSRTTTLSEGFLEGEREIRGWCHGRERGMGRREKGKVWFIGWRRRREGEGWVAGRSRGREMSQMKIEASGRKSV